ncbi:hypothetical protein COCMIDRAFT_109628, partial [Bipolaris oryzae ATCC 44560]
HDLTLRIEKVLNINVLFWGLVIKNTSSLPSSVVERVTSNDEVVSSILAEGILFATQGWSSPQTTIMQLFGQYEHSHFYLHRY